MYASQVRHTAGLSAEICAACRSAVLTRAAPTEHVERSAGCLLGVFAAGADNAVMQIAVRRLKPRRLLRAQIMWLASSRSSLIAVQEAGEAGFAENASGKLISGGGYDVHVVPTTYDNLQLA